jgi:hypothetical protein
MHCPNAATIQPDSDSSFEPESVETLMNRWKGALILEKLLKLSLIILDGLSPIGDTRNR